MPMRSGRMAAISGSAPGWAPVVRWQRTERILTFSVSLGAAAHVAVESPVTRSHLARCTF